MKLVATASIGLVLAAALPDAIAVDWSIAGDMCADAIPVTTSNTLFNTSTHTDSGFPVDGHCWGMGTVSKDIWFSYTPPTDGTVTVSTCAEGSFDTSVIVYQHPYDDCDQLIYVGCNGDTAFDPACQVYHSEVAYVASGGVEYLVRIGGWTANDSGFGILRLSVEEHDNPCECTGDTDEDNDIDVDDLLTVIDHWGMGAGDGDVNYDGVVGVSDVLAVLASWGICPQEYILNDTFELPIPAEVETDGIFAVWWAAQFDHAADTAIMFEQFNAIRDDCLNNLGMMDPPNPDSCFYYNIYVHHGSDDGYPDGWSNGQGTDPNSMPFLTLPAGLHMDPANTYHEGFHIFQYQASSPGFGMADAGWYIETSAQWYMSDNMPGDVNAFIEAGAILANPQLALWHGFGNQAPGDATDWYYQVRQYGMHTLLHYLVDVVGIDPTIMTNGFYSGTDLRPQEYLYTQIGEEAFRSAFADWAARNTGGLDYLTPEQVERALWEADYVGDPDNAHPHVLQLHDLQIDDTWIYEPCEGGQGDIDEPCLLPRSWAYNVIRIANGNSSTFTFTIEGEPIGTEGAASHFDGRIVVMSQDGPVYSDVTMTDDLNGQGSVTVADTDTEIFLVIVATPEHFTGNQAYPYRVEIQRSPLVP